MYATERAVERRGAICNGCMYLWLDLLVVLVFILVFILVFVLVVMKLL